jgi:hypothetical protein
MDQARVTGMELADRYLRNAIVFRVIGGISIVEGLLLSIWIGMGDNAGSGLWLWWTLGQFVFGAVCFWFDRHYRKRAAEAIANPGVRPESDQRHAA